MSGTPSQKGMSQKATVAQPSPQLRDDLIASIPNLRAFAISLCNDVSKADDLVQETLVKAWTHSASFKEGTNLKAWLFTILRNTYFSERRKLGRELQSVDGSYFDSLSVPPEQNGHADLGDFLRALPLLPPDQREALVLVGAEGFTYEEAATISGCEVGTVKSRVNRARNRLAGILKISGAADFATDPIGDAPARRQP